MESCSRFSKYVPGLGSEGMQNKLGAVPCSWQNMKNAATLRGEKPFPCRRFKHGPVCHSMMCGTCHPWKNCQRQCKHHTWSIWTCGIPKARHQPATTRGSWGPPSALALTQQKIKAPCLPAHCGGRRLSDREQLLHDRFKHVQAFARMNFYASTASSTRMPSSSGRLLQPWPKGFGICLVDRTATCFYEAMRSISEAHTTGPATFSVPKATAVISLQVHPIHSIRTWLGHQKKA